MTIRVTARMSRGAKATIGLTLSGLIGTAAGASSGPDMSLQRGNVASAPIIRVAEVGGTPLPATDPGADNVEIATDMTPAPTLFDASATVEWDGRRTMKGVWIAHPTAAGARKVRIFNLDTGAAVDGALFRAEERADRQQVVLSSDAAEALEMTAEKKARIRIVALRPAGGGAAEGKASATVAKAVDPESVTKPAPTPEKVVAAVDPKVTPLAPTPVPRKARLNTGSTKALEMQKRTEGFTFEPAKGAVPAPQFLEPAERVAASPLPPAEGGSKKAGAAPAITPPAAPPAASAAPLAESPEDKAAAERAAQELLARTTAKPEKPSLFDRLFGSSEEEPAPKAPDLAVPAEQPPVAPPPAVEKSRPPAKSGTAAPQPEKTFKLEHDATLTKGKDKPGEQKVAKAKPPAKPMPAANPSESVLPPLTEPYLQVGLFRFTKNADGLAERLRAKSIPVVVAPSGDAERPLVRVVAGPFPTAVARSEALAELKKMGLTDATPVRR